MSSVHCLKCGSNLDAKSNCRRCLPHCDKCGAMLILKDEGKHPFLAAAESNGKYLPYRTENECYLHSRYLKCPKECNGRREVLVFDDGKKFGYNLSLWEPIEE